MKRRLAALGLCVLAVAACTSAGEPVTTAPASSASSSATQPSVAAPATTSTEGSAEAQPTTVPAPTTTASTPPTTAAQAATLPPITGFAVEEVIDFDGFAIAIETPPGDDRLFVALKDGRVFTLGEKGSVNAAGPQLYLDIRSLVRDSGEQGLLGMAFHPDYASNGQFFAHYSNRSGDTTLARYTATDDRDRLDDDGGEVLLEVAQPAGNHNGGMVGFGPDGMLYLGLGDGGGSGDRFGQGQRPDTLLGALLRIDVSGSEGYSVPDDNPFVEGGGASEVWAYGLRNPFRFSFDEDLIYIGDVGQNAFEEVDVAPVAAAGLNYGWPITEAAHCFSPRTGCDASGLTLPALEIEHGDGGTCSVTGGLVYRGVAIPELTGHYLYSDFCGRYLRSFRYDGGQATAQQELIADVGAVASFGSDADGEIYLALADGRVLRLIARR